jgi:tartrate-resistant acid phosphatase type 5
VIVLRSTMTRQHATSRLNRRAALKTLFCASAALALNLQPRRVSADAFAAGDLHLLAIGDYGSQGKEQSNVSRAMQKYVVDHQLKTEGLLLLGDNFYGKMEGGLASPRWQAGFEAMHPAATFPGRCWAVLGNHDYHDNEGGQVTELAYARETIGTRWTMPAKWYRVDLPAVDPVMTMLCLDSDLRSVSGGSRSKPRSSLTAEEEEQQLDWLRRELSGPRAPLTLAIGHHPLYSNGSHGDSKGLIAAWGKLFQQHGVHVYLAGHDHDLQHLELDGLKTSFVVSGGGGARTRKLKSDRKTPFGQDVYGFSHLSFSRERLIVRHIDTSGTQVHAFAKLADGTVKLEV